MHDRFDFRQSSDCIMSAMTNIMRYNGFDLPDALIYGLGEGYFFWYADLAPDESPPVLIGKNVFLEHRLFENIGASLTVHEPVSPPEIEASYAHITAGTPTVIKADPYYFTYIDWPGGDALHFGEHVLIVVSIEGQTAYLADVFEDGIVAVPLTELRAARGSVHGMEAMHPRHRWYQVTYPDTLGDPRKAVHGALDNMLRHMFDSEGDFGLAGIERAAGLYTDRLRQYLDTDLGQFAGACQAGGGRMLEGHCGAFNRGMFERFMVLAAHMLDKPALSNPVLESQALRSWQTLGDLIMQKSETALRAPDAPDLGDFDAIDEAFAEAVENEKALCRSIDHALAA
ncbi:uncharacterized protein DUF4872 [Eilatimonas milleporae]|uniref:Uncharacterized protein DUF4872 n=2 Tax=Eilatimonas milleporae TaxID=911205 RepID=A0A3M0D6R0_9PROT|nr:uncharacterized protein DUF4872 [Eilatimonas milleporae]